jgi:tetratricopeptide (TPR) repeat protein
MNRNRTLEHRSSATPRRNARWRDLGGAALLAIAMGNTGCAFERRGPALLPIPVPVIETFDDRVRDAREHAAAAPTDPAWCFKLAELYVDADSLDQARTALSAALERDRAYAPALSMLSRLDYRAGRHQEAIQALEAARSSAGTLPPELLAGLALHYDAIDRPDLAARTVSDAPREGRDQVGAAYVYVMLRGANPDSAASLARDLARRHPKSAANQNNDGIAKLRAGDPEAARAAFLRAIDLDPGLAGPYYNLAILEKFYAMDDAAAGTWFEKYRQRSSDDPDSLAKLFTKTSRGLARQGN